MTEEKNWDVTRGDFQKKYIHEEHKKYKKREKLEKFFFCLFVVMVAGVIIYSFLHF
ncbi:MAG TPA: hypothetical protein PLT92_08520 [Ignavibacteriaceae bacterium]|jgi:hypothetical protein|nr:hypothetical protein [Ignavibacteriaceae bacterium]HOJ18589.1 hypothetical protein [Ignavibacteriaceae bacterium]HPO55456.1 hypothetical protein [Ignavibacteriaceae bacterium]